MEKRRRKRRRRDEEEIYGKGGERVRHPVLDNVPTLVDAKVKYSKDPVNPSSKFTASSIIKQF